MDMFVDFADCDDCVEKDKLDNVDHVHEKTLYPPLMRMYKSQKIGSNDISLKECNRIIDADKDIYTHPFSYVPNSALKETEPSQKYGINRLICAFYFLQPNRFREIFDEYYKLDHDIIFTDFSYDANVKQHMLHWICLKNMYTNYTYIYNRERYDAIFWHIIKHMNDLNAYTYKTSPFSLAIISEKNHYALIMLDRGYLISDEELQDLADKGAKQKCSILFNWRLNLIQLSIDKHKLMALVDKKKFVNPVIDTDGIVYEKTHAIELASKKNMTFVDFLNDTFIYSPLALLH
jgi:hypothetical protein